MLDGAGQHAEVADAPDLDLTGEFTITVWVNWLGVGEGNAIIVGKGARGRSGNYALRLNRTTPEVGFWWDAVGDKGAWSGCELKKNAWTFVAVTADVAHPTDPWMKIHVDGEKVVTYMTPEFRTSRRPRANNDPLCVGGIGEPPEREDEGKRSGCSFKGLVDDLRIYNRVLGPEELRALRALE
jgi:hypothetical protein